MFWEERFMSSRRICFAGLVCAIVLSVMARAQAQFSVTISVDENGNGRFTNTAGFNSALPAAMLPDPGPGGLASALTYGLLNPPGLTAGDLVLIDDATGFVSDYIRFNPTQNGGSLVFYSDNLDGVDALADTGFPSALYANSLAKIEVGAEAGPNGITYTPTAGQPGFITGAGGPVTYVIESDPAPEPTSLAAVGLLGAVTLVRRRTR
jgi:hypothetical protein